MKRTLCLLLSAAMLLALLGGCAATEPETTGESTAETTGGLTQESIGTPLCDGKTLKVLAIGNSFSNDATEYLYDVAQAEGFTEIVLGRLYFGGCSLERHVTNSKINRNEYTYQKNIDGKWVDTPEATLLQGLQDEAWDIITMQQNSSNSGLPGTYEGFLEELITYVNANKTNPNAKLVWHMTWAYQSDSTHEAFPRYDSNQMTMYTKIIEAVQQKIVPNQSFAAILPVGTAVQNARTSFFGDNMTRDGFHLQTLGKLIAAYIWYGVFTGKTLTEIKLDKTLTGITLSDGMKAVIFDSVNSALKTPFAVTQSAHAQWNG